MVSKFVALLLTTRNLLFIKTSESNISLHNCCGFIEFVAYSATIATLERQISIGLLLRNLFCISILTVISNKATKSV